MPDEIRTIFAIDVEWNDADALKKAQNLKTKLEKGLKIKASLDGEALQRSAKTVKEKAEKAFGTFTVKIVGSDDVEKLTTELGKAVDVGQTAKKLFNSKINVAPIKVVADSYEELNLKLQGVAETLRTTQKELGRPINVTGQVRSQEEINRAILKRIEIQKAVAREAIASADRIRAAETANFQHGLQLQLQLANIKKQELAQRQVLSNAIINFIRSENNADLIAHEQRLSRIQTEKLARAEARRGQLLAPLTAQESLLLGISGQSPAELAKFERLSRQIKDVNSSATRTPGKLAAISTQANTTAASISRLTSRLSFLATALVAQFAFDVISRSAEDVAALTSQVRGLEIVSARAGIAGGKLFRGMTSDAEDLSFAARDAAESINKLLVGGLEPSTQQIQQAQQTAIGASVIFGTSPSKNLNDLSTAALRTSRKIADNLGIMIRANEVYNQYAESIGKTANELSGIEKSQAFFNALLESTGAEALRAAAALDTSFKTLEQGKVTLNELFLSFGQVILEGIVPTVDGMNELNKETLDGIAFWTLYTLKVGAATAGVILLTRAFTGLNLQLAITAVRLLPLTIAVGAIVFAMDKQNKALNDQREGYLDSAQTLIQFEQFLHSVGLAFEQDAVKANAMTIALRDLNDPLEAARVIKYLESIEALTTAFSDSAKEIGVMETNFDAMSISIDEARGKIIEIASSGESYATKTERISAVNRALVDDLRNLSEELSALQEQNSDTTATSLTNWEEFQFGVNLILAETGDVVFGFIATIAGAIGTVAVGVATFVGGTFNFLAASLADVANKLINNTINPLLSKLSSIQIGGVSLPLGPGGTPIFLPGFQPFGGIGQVGNVPGGTEGRNFADFLAQTAGTTGLGEIAGFTQQALLNAIPGGDGVLVQGARARRQDLIEDRQFEAKQPIDKLSKLNQLIIALEAELDGAGDGKGKGKADPTRAELFKKITDGLETRLAGINAQISIEQDLAKLGAVERDVEIAKLEASKDEAREEALKAIRAGSFVDLLVKNETLTKEIQASLQNLADATDKQLAETKKQLETTLDSFAVMAETHEKRQVMFGDVEDTQLGQRAMSDLMKTMVITGTDSLDSLFQWATENELMVDRLKILRELTEDAALALPKMIEEELKDAAKNREEAQKIRRGIRDFQQDFERQQLEFQFGLLVAREPDPNRRGVAQFNLLQAQLGQELGRAPLADSPEEALQLSKAIQDLLVELEAQGAKLGLVTRPGSEGVFETALQGLRQRVGAALPELQDLALTAIEPMEQAALDLENAAASHEHAAARMEAAWIMIQAFLTGFLGRFGIALPPVPITRVGGGKQPTFSPQAAQTFKSASPDGLIRFNAPNTFDPGGLKEDFFQAGGDALGSTDIPLGAVQTRDEIKALQDAERQRLRDLKNRFKLDEAFGKLANSALAGASSVDELTDALEQSLGTLLNEIAQAKFPGLGGQLIGGGLNFLANTLFSDEEALPIEDNAVRMLLINPRDIAIEMSAVRDEREISLNSDWQQGFMEAAQGT